MALSNPLIKNIPIANPTTKEVLQDKLIIATDTPYLTNQTKQPSNELQVYSFSPTVSNATYTQTVASDFGLTAISIHIEATNNARHSIFINTQKILEIFVPAGGTYDDILDLPAVFVPKQSVLKIVLVGADPISCLHNFIGFRY